MVRIPARGCRFWKDPQMMTPEDEDDIMGQPEETITKKTGTFLHIWETRLTF